MPTVVFHAASPDPFFDRMPAVEAAVRASLPEGFALEVASDTTSLVKGLRDADAYVGWAFPTTLAKRARRLRYAYFLQAGIPEGWTHALNAEGETIHVDTAAGANADSVAEHALFLFLAFCRGLRADSFARGWDGRAFDVARAPNRLSVAVFGFGHVARALVRLLTPLVHHVTIVSRTPRAASDDAPRVYGLDEAEEVASRSDVIFLALPSTAEARAIFDARWLARLRPSVCLVNVARGDLLDERALLGFLEAHPEARYLADVTSIEPYPDDGALRRAPGVLLTPHLAGRREDVVARLADAVRVPLRAGLASIAKR